MAWHWDISIEQLQTWTENLSISNTSRAIKIISLSSAKFRHSAMMSLMPHINYLLWWSFTCWIDCKSKIANISHENSSCSSETNYYGVNPAILFMTAVVSIRRLIIVVGMEKCKNVKMYWEGKFVNWTVVLITSLPLRFHPGASSESYQHNYVGNVGINQVGCMYVTM